MTLLLGLLFSINFFLLFVIVPCLVGIGYLKWKYAGLSFNHEFMILQKYRGLRITTIITKKPYVEITGVTTNPFLKKNKSLHYFFPYIQNENMKNTLAII